MKQLLQQLLAIENFDVFLVLGILIFFGSIESFAGYLRHSKRKKGDWLQEVLSFFLLSTAIKPTIVASVFILGNTIYTEGACLLSQQSFITVFFGYILVDDLLQYWYHRSAHEYPFLWKLHRSHHQGEEMGYFVAYRNALLYYIMMPNIWWVGCIVFAGGAKAVALGLVIKQAIIISSHSRVKWDKPFYQYAFLKPFIMVIERIIITPSFHHAHHGTSMLDNSSDPNANFGNMFSLWDQFFGTAKFQTAYPEEYGLHKKTDDDWTAAYFYPFVKSKDKKSDWHKDFQLNKTSTNEALKVHLTKGENYLWCVCGKSSQQPFCDGSHHGSKVKPLKFTAKKTGEVKLCNCKATKKGPFCDDTHQNL